MQGKVSATGASCHIERITCLMTCESIGADQKFRKPITPRLHCQEHYPAWPKLASSGLESTALGGQLSTGSYIQIAGLTQPPSTSSQSEHRPGG